jgi:phage FluMu protein gp41
MADIQVANTDADLSDNTLITEENAYTITGLHTFSRSTNAPFACVSGAAVVAYLDADKLDGQEGSYYLAAANFTGTLAVNRGGTGAATFTDGGVLLGSGTSAITAMAVLGDGEILIGDASGDPTTLDVGSSSAITVLGTVATGVWQGTDVGVAYGGTGVSTLTDGGILLGSGTGSITALGVAANGQIPIGDGSGDPVLATLSGTSNEVDISNGSGSITVGLPASVTVTTALTISGTGASSLDVGGGINAGTGNVSLVGTDGKIEGPLSSTIIDDLSGANLTTLNASNISSGTLAAARLPAKVTVTSSDADALDVTGGLTIGSGDVALVGTDGKLSGPLSSTIIDDLSGANLTTLNAAALSSNTVPTARLGSGTASSGTFLRGDSAWAAMAAGGKVLQVIADNLASDVVSTATTDTDILDVSITPANTANKILVVFSGSYMVDGNSNSTYPESFVNMWRGSSSGTWLQGGRINIYDDFNTVQCMSSFTLVYLDSPSTTSAQEYTITTKNRASGYAGRMSWFGTDTGVGYQVSCTLHLIELDYS